MCTYLIFDSDLFPSVSVFSHFFHCIVLFSLPIFESFFLTNTWLLTNNYQTSTFYNFFNDEKHNTASQTPYSAWDNSWYTDSLSLSKNERNVVLFSLGDLLVGKCTISKWRLRSTENSWGGLGGLGAMILRDGQDGHCCVLLLTTGTGQFFNKSF